MPFSSVAFVHAPWSVHAVQGALECPFKFQQEHILHKKPKQETNSALKIGKAIHKVLEFALCNKPVKVALQAAAYDEKLTTPEIEELLSYTHNTQSFINRIEKYKKTHQVDKVLLEERFGLTADYRPIDFWDKTKNVFFRGTWDMVIRSGSRVLIIDHKSGEPKPITEHETQLNFYAIAAAYFLPDVKLVQTAIHYLQSEEILFQPAVSLEQVQHTMTPWYEGYIEKAAQAATVAEARRNKNCRYCGFAGICPAK